MAERRIVRCNLCNIKLCSLILTCKWLFASAFCNHYSKRLERSLPSDRRAEQRRRRSDFQFYQVLVIIGAGFHLLFTVGFYSRSVYGVEGLDYDMILPFIVSIMYMLTFWYMTQGKDKYAAISRAWHSGQDLTQNSNFHVPGHIKIVVWVTTVVQMVIHYLFLAEYEVAHIFLVTVLHCFSCYFLFNSHVISTFPQDRNGHKKLIYKRE